MLGNVALAALNHLLQGSAWARERLTPFAGRTARLNMPPLQLDLVVGDDGMFAETGSESFDVEIELPAGAPLMALGGADEIFRNARISGSAEFADALGFVLRNLRWDFEEDLSKGIGDIAAHRFASQLKAFGAWQQQAAQRMGENLVEYLTEEQPALANPRDVAEFAIKVKLLDDDLAALEKRIARLA
jgi:ubiquinone biosynthesis protein UbiJ